MSQTSRFELYSYWRTSATYRVRVALNLKQLSAVENNVNLDTNEQNSAEFLKLNPMGAIPAFFDLDGTAPTQPLTQSIAILEYLEEIAPLPPLMPASPYERARVRSLAGMLVSDTHPLITPRIKKYLVAHGEFDDAKWRAWQTHWFNTGLKAFENRLIKEPGTGRYVQGDAVSLADICMASIIVVARVFKIEVDDIPTIDRIMADLETLPAFSDADPYRQIGAPAVP